MSKTNDENKKDVIEKLLLKVNVLLNEKTSFKAERKELEKICNECLSFLKTIPIKNPLHKESATLYSELKARLDKVEKK